MVETLPFRCLPNPRRGAPGIVVLPQGGFRRAWADISAWPGYAPTPLHALPGIAREAGIAALHLKDESDRFGLGSFKALGGAYAVAGVLSAELARRGAALSATTADLFAGRYAADTRTITVACATDGNHGRSVAWGAQRFGAACAIFVHEGVSQARIVRHLLARLHGSPARCHARLPRDGGGGAGPMAGSAAAHPCLHPGRRWRRGRGGIGVGTHPARPGAELDRR